MDAGSNGEQYCGPHHYPCPSGMRCAGRSKTFNGHTFYYGVCEQLNDIEGGNEIEGENDASEMRGSYGSRIGSGAKGNTRTVIAIQYKFYKI